MCQIRRKKCERNCLHFKKAVGKSTFLNSKKLPQIQLFSSLCLRCKQMQSLVAVCDLHCRPSVGTAPFQGLNRKAHLLLKMKGGGFLSWAPPDWIVQFPFLMYIKSIYDFILWCEFTTGLASLGMWMRSHRQESFSFMNVRPWRCWHSLRHVPPKVPAPDFWSFLGVFHTGCNGTLWLPPTPTVITQRPVMKLCSSGALTLAEQRAALAGFQLSDLCHIPWGPRVHRWAECRDQVGRCLCHLYSHTRSTPRLGPWCHLTLFIHVFASVCAGSSSLHGLFSSCGQRGLLSSCDLLASNRGGSPCPGALALGPASFRNYGSWA